ncbi:PREDICTED: melanoma-associated antigen 4-like [Condylura cristata]|uniref:melanoma-associated antigen 4-like n=1 Tax=Condylura cristata TaxID=143302 RepID=UPI000643BFE5|nr:PREDICTED: melanoma-associated antigen 4-like [Condylura cristata]
MEALRELCSALTSAGGDPDVGLGRFPSSCLDAQEGSLGAPPKWTDSARPKGTSKQEHSELGKPEGDHREPRVGPSLQSEPLLQLQAADGQDVTSLSSFPSTSLRFSLVLQDTIEDEAAAGALSAPQSPATSGPIPRVVVASLCSSSEEESGNLPVPAEGQAPPQASPPEMSNLVCFLLLKYCRKETTSKAEMLREVLGNDQKHFPSVFSEACKCMQLVFGIDVTEAEPGGDTYGLTTTLGLTYDGLTSPEQTMPKTGLLVIVLGVILLGGDCASEAHMWEALSMMGLYVGSKHVIFGEPRELLTEVWVQEQYLEYRQVPNSDPAQFEFLWGARAHAETNKMEVLARFLKINSLNSNSFLPVPQEAREKEQEEA